MADPKQEEDKQDLNDPTTSPAVQGEESVGGSAEDPSIDDDIDEMVESVLGKQPKIGQTFNDLINDAEKRRR